MERGNCIRPIHTFPPPRHLRYALLFAGTVLLQVHPHWGSSKQFRGESFPKGILFLWVYTGNLQYKQRQENKQTSDWGWLLEEKGGGGGPVDTAALDQSHSCPCSNTGDQFKKNWSTPEPQGTHLNLVCWLDLWLDSLSKTDKWDHFRKSIKWMFELEIKSVSQWVIGCPCFCRIPWRRAGALKPVQTLLQEQ